MKLADKTIINIIAKSSHGILLIISSIVFTRTLTKLEYGTYLQAMLIVNTTISLTFFGLPQSIFYFTPYVDHRDKFIIRNIIISIIMAIAASSSIFLLRNYLSIWLNNEHLVSMGLFIALIVMFRAPSQFAEPFLISNNNLLLNAIFIVVENIMIYCPVIIAALLGKSISYILGVMAFSSGFVLIIFLTVIVKLVLESKKELYVTNDVKDVKEKISIFQQIKYSIPIGLSSHLSILGKRLDQYLVSIFFLPIDFAVYSRGAIEIPVLGKIHFVVNRILMPNYVESFRDGDTKKFLYYYHESIKKIAKIKYPLFSFLFVVSPSIITLLFTEQYIGSVWIFRCYAISLLMNVTVFNLVPRVTGNTSCLIYVTALSIVSNLTISLILIKLIGVVGAAIATICAGTITSGYLIKKSCKMLNIPIRKFWPWKFLIRLLFITMIAVTPVFILEYLVSLNNIPLLIMLFIKAFIYVYLILLLMNHKRIIEQDEFDLISRWLKFNSYKLINKITFVKAHKVPHKGQGI